MYKSFLFLLALTSSGTVLANCTASGSCTNVKVTELRTDTNGSTYVGTSGAELNLRCTPGNAGSGKEQLVLDAAGANYQAVYSLILSSYVTDSSVTIRTSNNAGESCKVLYAVMEK